MEQKGKIDQLVAENQELLALTKQAFMKREVEKESVSVDEEWEKFYAEHAEEIEALGSDNRFEPHTATIKASIKREQNDACINFAEREKARPNDKKRLGILPNKVAASVIGILFTAGVAFAAFHIVRMVSSSKSQTTQTQQITPVQPTRVTPTDTIKADSTLNTQPVIFDNLTLDKILPQIATYYKKEVEFQNTDARLLRFYFVWKPDDGLDVTLHRLNLFESIDIELKDNKIVVK